MASKKRKRGTTSESEDSWSSDSENDSFGKGKKTGIKGYSTCPIQRETSKWEPQVLQRLNLSWDRNNSDSPSDVVKRFLFLHDVWYEDPENVEELENFIAEILNFDIDLSFFYEIPLSVDGLSYKDWERRRDAISKLNETFNGLKQLQAKIYDMEIKGKLSNMKHAICLYSIEFIEEVKEYLSRTKNHEQAAEMSFVSMLEKFCRVCGLYGSVMGIKRECQLEGVLVNAIPDLIFTELRESMDKTSEQRTILCVAKIKKCYYEYDSVHKGGRMTRSSGSQDDTSTEKQPKLLPIEIQGSSRHAGQLLLECINMAQHVSLGLMCCETKVMMTCVKLSENYMSNVKEKLHYSDSGIIYHSNMYNILKAEERKEMVKAVLKLGFIQKGKTK